MELIQNALYQKSYTVGFNWGISVSYTIFKNIFLTHVHYVNETFWDNNSSLKKRKIQKLKPKIQELLGAWPRLFTSYRFWIHKKKSLLRHCSSLSIWTAVIRDSVYNTIIPETTSLIDNVNCLLKQKKSWERSNFLFCELINMYCWSLKIKLHLFMFLYSLNISLYYVCLRLKWHYFTFCWQCLFSFYIYFRSIHVYSAEEKVALGHQPKYINADIKEILRPIRRL